MKNLSIINKAMNFFGKTNSKSGFCISNILIVNNEAIDQNTWGKNKSNQTFELQRIKKSYMIP